VKLRVFFHTQRNFVRSPNDTSAKASNNGTDVAVSILCAISEFRVMDISPTKTRDVSLSMRMKNRKAGLCNIWGRREAAAAY
jgi:hypothetical protein